MNSAAERVSPDGRLKPAFALLLLAPLIAEYLLGSLSFGQLGLFPIMLPMYGGGALLVRELARRRGRGWPTMLSLGVAFGVIEEGLATQSLFNPHYLGRHLLEYGFLPTLGIGAPWTVYVLGLHVAWSIAVPIGFVEALSPGRRETPWLGRPGLIVTALVYGLGVGLITFGSRRKEIFMASETQLLVAAAATGVFIVGAFVLFRRPSSAPSETLSPARSNLWQPGVTALVAGSLFHLLAQFGGAFLPAWASVIGLLIMPAAVIAVVRATQKAGEWTHAHTDALVCGGLLVYCWLGFFLAARLHGAGAIPGQLFPCVIVLGLLYFRIVRGSKA